MTSRTLQENEDLVRQMELHHKQFKTSLRQKNKSRKWAVWYLQGALLGLAYRATQQQLKNEDHIPILMLYRLSSEYLSQIAYFANPNTKMDAISKWMKVWSPLSGYPATFNDLGYSGHKKRLDIYEKPREMPENVDFSLGDYDSQLNSFQSLWTHPSYNLTRILFDTDNNDGGYQLYNFRTTFRSDSVAGLAVEQIVNNAAAAIHIGSYLYGDVVDYESLIKKHSN